jgi:hypothetical protein
MPPTLDNQGFDQWVDQAFDIQLAFARLRDVMKASTTAKSKKPLKSSATYSRL